MSYDSEVLADSPLKYWKLQETAGSSTVTDEVVGATGTVVGGVTLGVAGPTGLGTGATFDGTTGRIDFAVATFAGRPFTIEFWAKQTPTAWGSCYAESENASNANDTIQAGFAEDHFEGSIRAGTAWDNVESTTGGWNDGDWHYVVVVFTGAAGTTTVDLYVDGVADGSGTISAGNPSGLVRGAIGVLPRNNPTDWLAGSVSHVALYGTALSSTRIAAHFAAASSTPVVLEGASDNAGQADGALSMGMELEGTTISTDGATGSLSRERTLAGTTDSADGATGTLAASIELAGTTDSVADASGTLQSSLELAGTTDSASTGSGSLESTISLAGTSTSASSGSGTLQATRDLAGTSTSIETATGALSSELALAGVSDSVGSAVGALSISGQVDLASTSYSTATASGSLAGSLAISGTSTSTSSGTATLSIAGLVELAGTTLEASDASGALSGTTHFEGTADATDGGTGQLTTSGEVKRDTMVLPIAEDLLACLCVAVAEAPNPPASCCLRPGVTVAQGVSEREDECCEGLAWVRVSRVFPTGSEVGFPAINDDPFACSPPSYGIELEMGIYRCAPTGDERNLPTCDEWTAATEQILDDAASMRRAWCCFRDNYDNSAKLVGEWTPVTVQGGCTGGTMTIMIESYCSDCIDGS